MRKWALLFWVFLLSNRLCDAQPLRIAVAANAQFVVKALQRDFKRRTGIETEIIPGSSGKLTAQIKHGAPYDLFLSADMQYPQTLFKEGHGIGSPEVYAVGHLIVCSASLKDIARWKVLVQGEEVRRLALANPLLAPYGEAARTALLRLGIWNGLKKKVVLGESISQVNTYIESGVVDLGFTTESFIRESTGSAKFYWTRVDKKLYKPLQQGMLILKHAKKGNYKKALMFCSYLNSPEAKSVFRRYGYSTL